MQEVYSGTETPNTRGVVRHRDPKYTRCVQAQRPQIHEVCSGTETPNTRGVFRHRYFAYRDGEMRKKNNRKSG